VIDLFATEWDLFALIALLEARAPGAPIGEHGPAASEAIRLRAAGGLGFAPGDVVALARGADGAVPWQITTPVLGLIGAGSPLPSHCLEPFATADGDDSAARALCDTIQHRLLSLLHRGIVRHRYALGFRRDATDAVSQQLTTWLGIDAPLARAAGASPVALLRLAPELCAGADRPAALARLLSQLLATPVEITPLWEQTIAIPTAQRAHLGRDNARLGHTLVLGSTMRDCAGGVSARLPELAAERAVDFLPGGPETERIRALVAAVLPLPLGVELELSLAQRERGPRLHLGRPRAPLGRSSFLCVPPRAIRCALAPFGEP
jgi:type VI secretion system ImpH/TssG family protein